MNDDYTDRLQRVLHDLAAESGRIQRVGRGLTAAELHRAQALDTASELLRQAIDALAAAQPPDAAPPQEERTAADWPREAPAAPPQTGASAAAPAEAVDRMERIDRMEDASGFGRGGDDDTPGWERGGGGLA